MLADKRALEFSATRRHAFAPRPAPLECDAYQIARERTAGAGARYHKSHVGSRQALPLYKLAEDARDRTLQQIRLQFRPGMIAV
jgi:hypothetical protein